MLILCLSLYMKMKHKLNPIQMYNWRVIYGWVFGENFVLGEILKGIINKTWQRLGNEWRRKKFYMVQIENSATVTVAFLSSCPVLQLFVKKAVGCIKSRWERANVESIWRRSISAGYRFVLAFFFFVFLSFPLDFSPLWRLKLKHCLLL